MRDTPATSAIALDELYHCNSKHSRLRLELVSGRERRRHDRAVHALYEASKNRFKTYPSAPRVDLPADALGLDVSLGAAICGRRSVRRFSAAPVIAPELATLLRRSYGITARRGDGLGRAVPSGGGLYPLDLYVMQFAGGVVEEGVYHYHAGGHYLQQIAAECDRQRLRDACVYPEIVAEAALLLAVVADMPRTRAKYGERAYRLALLEAGHVSQTLYLVAHALGLGIIALDGFYDDEVHAVLDVDGVMEIALALFAVGHPRG
jgi:SagB-type dehydrogenase family enzyme